MSHNVLMEGFAMGKVKKSAQRSPVFDRVPLYAPIDDWNYLMGPETRKRLCNAQSGQGSRAEGAESSGTEMLCRHEAG